jgi:hypothetical protein
MSLPDGGLQEMLMRVTEGDRSILAALLRVACGAPAGET